MKKTHMKKDAEEATNVAFFLELVSTLFGNKTKISRNYPILGFLLYSELIHIPSEFHIFHKRRDYENS